MDDELKIMIAGTMKMLSEAKDKSWESIIRIMKQNELLEPYGTELERTNTLVKEGSAIFKADGSTEKAVMREVCSQCLA